MHYFNNIMNITKQQLNSILEQKPEGATNDGVISQLIDKGYVFDGVDMNQARDISNNLKQQRELNKQKEISDEGVSGVEGFAQGFGKGILETVKGAGQLGEQIGGALLPDFATPRDVFSEEALNENTAQGGNIGTLLNEENLRAKGTAEKVGKTVEKIVEFAIPGTKISKAGKGAGFVKNVVGQSVGSGTIASVQAGEVGQETAIAAATDIVLPGIGKFVLKPIARGGSRLLKEGLGILSGTSEETITAASQAVSKGGQSKIAFNEALSGNVTPEQIANTLRNAVDTVESTRGAAYTNQLREIAENVVDTSDVTTSFTNKLNKFGIKIVDGVLDFTESKLRTSPSAQTKLVQTFDEVLNLSRKGTTNIADIDTTRQALGVLELTGDDASARAANSLIGEAKNSVKEVGLQVEGYGKLLEDFSESSDFLGQLRKDLMTGDNQTVDQTFRRMVTSLKTNNEQRMALIKELDNVTGSSITSQIAGQQLSEIMPRGIISRILAPALGGAALTGGASLGFIPLLALSSPKVIGQSIRALDLADNVTKVIIDAIVGGQQTLADLLGVQVSAIAKVILNNQEN